MNPASNLKKTRSQAVTNQIRELIVQGKLSPGTHLQEIRLSSELSVSRTPIRTALNTLANEGFLIYQPNQGYFVRELNINEIMDTYEIRALLEGAAARRAAEKGISCEDEAELHKLLQEGDRILKKGHLSKEDINAYRTMNVNIHEIIIRSSGSTRLAEYIQQTHNLPLVSSRIIIWWNFDLLKRSHDDHHRLLKAISSGEAWRAEALMREHVYYSAIALRDYFSSPENQSNNLNAPIDLL